MPMKSRRSALLKICLGAAWKDVNRIAMPEDWTWGTVYLGWAETSLAERLRIKHETLKHRVV
jgi:hypothetical protein